MGHTCLCQKPLTHTVWEARQLAVMARKNNICTQMGNQGTAADGLREGASTLELGTRRSEGDPCVDQPSGMATSTFHH